MAILAVLYSGAYAVLGVRLAVPIGITAGMLNFIPYVGGAFALVAGVLMSLLSGWHPWQLAGVVLAYTVVQTLEGFVITPRIVGKTVGLSEIWVLVALFVGGQIFGFLGILLAVPAAVVAKIFVIRGVQYYRTTALFRHVPPASVPEQNPTPRGARRHEHSRVVYHAISKGPRRSSSREISALHMGSADAASLGPAGPVPLYICVPRDQNRTGNKNRRIDPGDYTD
jgi:hypothetical protein